MALECSTKRGELASHCMTISRYAYYTETM